MILFAQFNHFRYAKYLPLKKMTTNKVFEVGLGCNMDYGPGASSEIWRHYFPHADIHFLEYDTKCTDKWQDRTRSINITVHAGDQGNVYMWTDLFKNMKNIDVFIDDGGHWNKQLITTFAMMQSMMSSGGLMFIEDIGAAAYYPGYVDSHVGFDKNFLGYVRNMAERLISGPPNAVQTLFQMIECQIDICFFKLK